MWTRETLRSTLSKLLEEEMGQSYPELADDQELRESLNLDSVDVVGLVMRIEREFRVRLATEELATVRRVGDLLDLMEAKLAERPEDPEAKAAPASTEPEPS
jgi:acyl carrier protein